MVPLKSCDLLQSDGILITGLIGDVGGLLMPLMLLVKRLTAVRTDERWGLSVSTVLWFIYLYQASSHTALTV